MQRKITESTTADGYTHIDYGSLTAPIQGTYILGNGIIIDTQYWKEPRDKYYGIFLKKRNGRGKFEHTASCDGIVEDLERLVHELGKALSGTQSPKQAEQVFTKTVKKFMKPHILNNEMYDERNSWRAV